MLTGGHGATYAGGGGALVFPIWTPARTQLGGNTVGAEITPNITPNSKKCYLILLYSG